MHGLRVIPTGWVADQQLNEKEGLFPDAWLRSQDALRNHGGVVNIFSQMGEALEAGKVVSDERMALSRKT